MTTGDLARHPPGLASTERMYAPAASRNRAAILDMLRGALPPSGAVLEIASGGGEHIALFAAAFPRLSFIPSDIDPAARRSAAAWIAEAGVANVVAPIALDAAAEPWPVTTAAAVLAINLTHISPFAVSRGLLRGAARILPDGGLLYLYGPFKQNGRHLSDGNAAFDRSLRANNPDWGVRDVADIAAAARAAGFGAPDIVAMPSANLSLLFRRDPRG